MENISGLLSLIELSKKNLGRGLVFVFEGVEAVGKTSMIKYLHDILIKHNVKSELLIEYYERTDKTGPLIAAITENPCIKIENDITLFLLYCARLNDKLYSSIKIANNCDIVFVDRLDISLYARALYGWNIEEKFISNILTDLCKHLYEDQRGIYVLCLDAIKKIRNKRSSEKPKLRRRDFLTEKIKAKIRIETLDLCRRRNVPIINTSSLSFSEILNKINEKCINKIAQHNHERK